jgi:hypothetical protein
MSDYTPDRWVVVEIAGKDQPRLYKVFASWYGGFAGSDSWKLNSGITKVVPDDDGYAFHGSSGSVYYCGKNSYGTNMYGGGVLANMIDQAKKHGTAITVLPESTPWTDLNYD